MSLSSNLKSRAVRHGDDGGFVVRLECIHNIEVQGVHVMLGTERRDITHMSVRLISNRPEEALLCARFFGSWGKQECPVGLDCRRQLLFLVFRWHRVCRLLPRWCLRPRVHRHRAHWHSSRTHSGVCSVGLIIAAGALCTAVGVIRRSEGDGMVRRVSYIACFCCSWIAAFVSNSPCTTRQGCLNIPKRIAGLHNISFRLFNATGTLGRFGARQRNSIGQPSRRLLKFFALLGQRTLAQTILWLIIIRAFSEWNGVKS